MATFCKHLTNGVVYNNDVFSINISPCCFFSKNYNVVDDIPKYRTLWLQEDLSKTCEICTQAEQAGEYSYRQASFDLLPGNGQAIEFLTVAVNKKCNLACVSCTAYSSSFWYQENKRNGVIQRPIVEKMHSEDKAGDITDKFLELLARQDLSQLKYIKFGGGEPLMSDTHVKILKLIPNPDQVTVQYTSNFSIMPDLEVFKLWEKFQLVKWVASLDGTQEQFDFLRWPYTWKKLEKFVVDAKQSVPGNVMFGVEHTLNPLNIFYFDRFQVWFDQNFSSNRYGDTSDLNLHLCRGSLDITHTHPMVRQMVNEKFGKTHPLSIFLQQNPYSGNTGAMVEYLDQVNAWRNQNWRQIFPEVEQYYV